VADQIDFTMNTNMHSAFKRETCRLRDSLVGIDLSDAQRVSGLRRRYRFFSTTLHAHHEGEDTYLWPPAQERATPAEKVVLQAMTAEHIALQDTLNHLDEGMGSLGPGADTAALGGHFDELLAVLNGHCAHEERDGVPIVQKYLTRPELKDFMAFTRAQEDSALVLPWVCDGATEQEKQTTWAMMPGFVRLFVRPMTTRKYQRFTRECGV